MYCLQRDVWTCRSSGYPKSLSEPAADSDKCISSLDSFFIIVTFSSSPCQHSGIPRVSVSPSLSIFATRLRGRREGLRKVISRLPSSWRLHLKISFQSKASRGILVKKFPPLKIHVARRSRFCNALGWWVKKPRVVLYRDALKGGP